MNSKILLVVGVISIVVIGAVVIVNQQKIINNQEAIISSFSNHCSSGQVIPEREAFVAKGPIGFKPVFQSV